MQLDVGLSRHKARQTGDRLDSDSIEELPNRHGSRGWELAGVIKDEQLGIMAFLKRRSTEGER
jgi:hypothetical protein